ncbi:MAG: hypothetical protein J6Y76_05165 [Paludibacteraceae bacterium]|jgi:hypothetical protein|nr:hypothetical protein [Paludibacteraceae bacterium]
MKQHILTIALLLSSLMVFGQNDEFRPSRTPEEEALKQTEMLSRELSLSEQQRDTVYRIHLKYAKLRQVSNTRAEGLARLNAMTQELLNIMTPEQREAFLNKQIEPRPRRVQPRLVRAGQ